jgi:hypothetical protein
MTFAPLPRLSWFCVKRLVTGNKKNCASSLMAHSIGPTGDRLSVDDPGFADVGGPVRHSAGPWHPNFGYGRRGWQASSVPTSRRCPLDTHHCNVPLARSTSHPAPWMLKAVTQPMHEALPTWRKIENLSRSLRDCRAKQGMYAMEKQTIVAAAAIAIALSTFDAGGQLASQAPAPILKEPYSLGFAEFMIFAQIRHSKLWFAGGCAQLGARRLSG